MTRRFNLVDARTENERSSRAREHRAGGPVFDAAQARLRTGHSAAQRGEAERRRSHATRCLLRPAREAVGKPGDRRMTSGPPRKQQWAGRSTALLLPPRRDRRCRQRRARASPGRRSSGDARQPPGRVPAQSRKQDAAGPTGAVLLVATSRSACSLPLWANLQQSRSARSDCPTPPLRNGRRTLIGAPAESPPRGCFRSETQ